MSDTDEGFDPRSTIELQNVVASSGIDQELDLQSVAVDLQGAEYDPETFPGLIYRMETPQATVLLFRSGKIVSTGASSPEAVDRALSRFFTTLCDLGVDVGEEPGVTVENIVADGDFGQSLNLTAIAIGLGLETIEYEPEQFPGLVYRLAEPSVVVLLFGSGKLVVTGATTREGIDHAIDSVASRLADLGLLE